MSAPFVSVGPLKIFDGSQQDVVDTCLELIRREEGGWVATANADYLALARRDRRLRLFLEKATLTIADGAPIAWLARLNGGTRAQRLAGVDLVERLLGASDRPARVALYGSDPRTCAAAAEYLTYRHPSARIVLSRCPPFRALTPQEEEDDRNLLADSDPDVVLVALGCPKQDSVILRYRDACPRALWIGVGGSFDFYAGSRRRAPGVIQDAGFEWAVRLMQEPGRLWRRYLVRDAPALARVAAHSLAFRGTKMVAMGLRTPR